jgi:hypothetical protein
MGLQDVAVSQDGQSIIAASSYSSALAYWYLPKGQALIDYARRLVGEPTPAEQQQYRISR